MAAGSRRQIVQPGKVGVYHCWNRCVRRARLCGFDPVTRKNFNYRRRWIRKQEQQLARLFAIEIAFHSEMSNHIHLVLRTRPDVVATWSDEEVVKRWLKIAQLKRGRCDEPSEPTEAKIRYELGRKGRVAKLRRRLSNVSWFMGALCENIARRCNREDGCTGKFWEARFSCRNLVEEGAILICGIYVDLNPIRTGEASVPEQACHTSAYDRIEGRKRRMLAMPTPAAVEGPPEVVAGEIHSVEMPPDGWLCELTLGNGPDADVRLGTRSSTPWRASDKGILSVSLEEYLQLLDWTGRQVKSGKRGAIPSELAPILDRLCINSSGWLESVEHFDKRFGRMVASSACLADKAVAAGLRWFRGVRAAAQTFIRK